MGDDGGNYKQELPVALPFPLTPALSPEGRGRRPAWMGFAALNPSYLVKAMNNSGSFSGRRATLSTTVYCRPKMSATYSSAFGSRLMQ